MAVNLSPQFNDTQFTNTGTLAVGYKIYTYAEGSSTPLTTYTTSAGTVAQANPIILNARGEVNNLIWLTAGLGYKLVLTTDTDVVVRTEDNLRGINDTSISVDQWVISGITPTYVSATQFTLAGDQTSTAQVGRRVKATVTAGTVYGTISVSAFAALTTVTLVMDTGQVLDSGLSALSYGLLTPQNPSSPILDSFTTATFASNDYIPFDDVSDSNKNKKGLVSDIVTLSTTAAVAAAPSKIQSLTATQAAGAITTTYAGGTLDFRSATLTSGTPTTLTVASNNGVLPSGATLGAVTTISTRIAVLEYYNAGVPVLGWANILSLQLDETNLVSPTTISAGSTSATTFYSASAVGASTPYRVIGFFDAVNTAGAWGNPTTVQGVGGEALTALSSIGYGQTRTVLGGARVTGTTYYNTTGKPIILRIVIVVTGAGNGIITIGGTALNSGYAAAANNSVFNEIVLPGESYVLSATNVTSISQWVEIR